MGYKKVLVVSNMYPSKKYPSYGIFVKNFCEQLTEIGIINDISVLTKTSNKIAKAVKYGLFYITTFAKSWLGGYDLVYIHYPSFSAKPVLLAHKLRKFDIFTNVHGTDVVPLKSEHEKMMDNTQNAMKLSKKVVVPSEYYRQLVIEKYQLNSNGVTVYPSAGVNEKVFFPYDDAKMEEILNEYEIDKNMFVIGFVSRINRAKGWNVFIDVIEDCSWIREESVRIFIVGSGEDDEELEHRVNALPEYIKRTIIRYPLLSQKKLADLYNLFDVFVFPTMSASESLGLVAIEAMACGTPVIASNYAAPAYYVVDDVNGYKFEKGNVNELSSILRLINHDEKRLIKLSEGALTTAENYKTENIKRILVKLFEE